MTDAPKITLEEALQKQQGVWYDFDFEKILDPYRESGREGAHREPRTWGRIISWLTDKHKFELETVAAAVLLTCLEMREGKVFEGDGTYGSKGSEFVNHIRNTARVIQRRKIKDGVFMIMGQRIYEQLRPMILEDFRKLSIPWYKRLWRLFLGRSSELT